MKNILDVNLLAASICTREAVKSMKNRKVNGHIVYMNSVLGHNPILYDLRLNLYETSKCAITGLAGVIRREMRLLKLPIKISCISPGLVNTDMPAIQEVFGDKIHTISHLEIKDVVEAVLYAIGTLPNVEVQDVIIAARHA